MTISRHLAHADRVADLLDKAGHTVAAVSVDREGVDVQIEGEFTDAELDTISATVLNGAEVRYPYRDQERQGRNAYSRSDVDGIQVDIYAGRRLSVLERVDALIEVGAL